MAFEYVGFLANLYSILRWLACKVAQSLAN